MKKVFTASILDSQHERNSAGKKPARLLFVLGYGIERNTCIFMWQTGGEAEQSIGRGGTAHY